MTNTKIVCSYPSYFLGLPVVLVGFQVEGYPLRLHHVYQGRYVVLNYIFFYGAKRKFFATMLTSYGDGASQRH